ncbi:MAG TPA: lysylphosphatidylglycerol synthase transmembrane domain-containing protein [Gaiellaceae bacterium]|nr:lysylphosphatidylglycerol synthase transmembrane domain-containing protein [Gaiellaceae bacterium]
MSHFFHAVGVFFHHLAAVKWEFLGLALACHVVKLLFRAGAWRAIVDAAYPDAKLKYRSALGAYVAGVGVNSIVPARGGDLVKLYLVKGRLPGGTYATLAPTLVVETLFDAVAAGLVIVWALASGVLPTHEVYSRLPDVDWTFFLRHERFTLYLLGALIVVFVVGFFVLRARVREFRERVRRGFAILGDRPRFVRSVLVPQALSWVLRISSLYFFLEAFGVNATIHNALIALTVDSLSTLFPATPGGAGTKQGLTELLFRGRGESHTLLLAFSVGMNIAITVVNLLLGLIAIGLMARTLSFKKLRGRAHAAEEQPA